TFPERSTADAVSTSSGSNHGHGANGVLLKGGPPSKASFERIPLHVGRIALRREINSLGSDGVAVDWHSLRGVRSSLNVIVFMLSMATGDSHSRPVPNLLSNGARPCERSSRRAPHRSYIHLRPENAESARSRSQVWRRSRAPRGRPRCRQVRHREFLPSALVAGTDKESN